MCYSFFFFYGKNAVSNDFFFNSLKFSCLEEKYFFVLVFYDSFSPFCI